MATFIILLCFTLFSQHTYSQNTVWADTVFKCTSQKGQKQHSPQQILGEPDAMPQGGSNPVAWGPKTRNDLAILKLGFPESIKARQVILAENHYPGCVYRVFIYPEKGGKKRIFINKKDTITADKRMFHVSIPSAPRVIDKVEVHVVGAYRKGWPQIDAVGLKSSERPYQQAINKPDKIQYRKPEPLNESVNSRYDEVHPLITPDGNRLYFVRSNHPQNKGGKDAGDAIWYLKKNNDGTWGKPKQLGEPLNNQKSNVITSIIPGNNLAMVRDSYSEKPPKEKSVAISEKKSLGWGKPIPQTIKDYYNKNESSSFFLANDGRTLILALERFKGEGGLDFYVSFKSGENKWSEPKHMGEEINTAADEITPFLASDNRTLYFSTKGFPSYGNHDIFMTQRKGDSWTDWQKPVNLGKGINTSEWDAYFTIPASGAFGYYVSYQNQRNMADIYQVKMPVNLKPQPVKLVQGKVINEKTGRPMKAEVINQNLAANQDFAENLSAPEKGTYQSIVPKGEKSGIFAKSKEYIAKAETIDAKDIDSFQKVKQDIRMIPIEVGQTIRLDNIFFEFNKASLKPSSYPELDRVSELMNDHPDMEIEVAGHTDSVGSEEYNLKLSRKRARSVKKYLVDKKGIAPKRIQAKGYGEEKPVATNKTEKGRQENRRVNFTILKK